ncbi:MULTISPECIES: hypothetical protein [unclassified Agrococcus]|uniref:hypothetical protein n=1 Tax=unclassified Agrococcus TaxID=2615065 RepID=UPI003620F7D9
MKRTELEALAASWRAQPPAPMCLRQVADLLIERYAAYEIPLSTIPAHDLVADDEVREADAAMLLTITDPRALERVFDEQDREALRPDPDHDSEWLEQGRRDLFVDPAEVGFRLLHLEQSRGERASILLEARDGIATGFRVYNMGALLVPVLIAHIGPPCFLGDARVGDVDDEQFAQYLVEAKRHGLLSP